MSCLYAGFSRVNITPMRGVRVVGYYIERFAQGVLDDLEANALALRCGTEKAVLLTLDHCGVKQDVIADFTDYICQKTGLPKHCVFIHATHSHTAPILTQKDESALHPGIDGKAELEYYDFVRRRLADAAAAALEDLKPARMGFGTGLAPNVAFSRRFRMKDGTVRTNPGVNNPEIAHPIGQVDERVNVLRFDREGGDTLVLVNFGNHPDVVGGSKISADWPGFLRKGVEKSLDGTRCIFFNGAQGDVNHVNVHPTGGFLNDLFMDFDDVARGYHHARYIGRVVTAGVLQAFDKVQYIPVDSIRCLRRPVRIPANLPDPANLPEAHRISQLHQTGRDSEIPYTGMMLTTIVAEAARMVRLEHGPEDFPMELSGLAIGSVALIGLPGEPFTGIGLGLKASAGWDLVLPCCQTNGAEGYFPMQDAYQEGGYEAKASNFKAGVAEYLVDEGKKLLADLQK